MFLILKIGYKRKGKRKKSVGSKGRPLVLPDLLAMVRELFGRHAAAVPGADELTMLVSEPHAGAGLTRWAAGAQDRHAVQGGRLDKPIAERTHGRASPLYRDKMIPVDGVKGDPPGLRGVKATRSPR